MIFGPWFIHKFEKVIIFHYDIIILFIIFYNRAFLLIFNSFLKGVNLPDIDFVELVGEATRIPCCIEVIKDIFGKEPSRTLNSTDCISRGCALQAAMLSPNYQVSGFEVEENNQQPISISYKFKGTEKVVTKELFKVGTSFPSTKSITFEKK